MTNDERSSKIDIRISKYFFFFQAEDGIRYWSVTGVQTCALPIYAIFKGQVIDEKTKEPLAGAYVHFDNKKGAALTDAFGQFSIAKMHAGMYELTVKYVGYKEFKKQIELVENKITGITISLQEKTD